MLTAALSTFSSGRRGTADWPNGDANVKRTKDVLQTLIDDFYVPEYRDTVTAIELLNEPAGFLGGRMMVGLRSGSLMVSRGRH